MPQYRNPDFGRLPGGLGRVFASPARCGFFDLPQWYDLMTRFGVPDGAEIRVYTDERPGSTAALPLYAVAGRSRRCLNSLANFYSVEHGIVAAREIDLERACDALIAEILGDRPRWDCLRLAELDPRRTSYAVLHAALQDAGMTVEHVFASGNWYEETAGLGFADFLATRPSTLRHTWRRKRRALDRSARAHSAFYPGELEIDEAVAHYQMVYAASWKPAEAFPRFIPALIQTASELGALRLGICYIDDAPAAVQFWILWDGRAIIYKLAHDKRFDSLSVGTLLTMEMMERVLSEDRPAEISFGRGDDAYKKLWLPKRRERWHLDAYNRRTATGLALGVRREAARIYHLLRGKPITPPVDGMG